MAAGRREVSQGVIGSMGALMRVGCYKVGNERVSVMREIVAAPVLGPGLRVVGDGAVCAPRKAEFSASANDCGLPRLAASDVGVGAAPPAAVAVAAQSRQLSLLA